MIADTGGVNHNWRHELIEVLKPQRRPTRSCVNRSDRRMEGVSVQATSYAVLNLHEALRK